MALSDRQKLSRAMAALGPLGYQTDMGTECCNVCARTMLSERQFRTGLAAQPIKMVFWSEDADRMAFGSRHGSTLKDALHLSWDGDILKIAKVLEDEGLEVILPEVGGQTIQVLPGLSEQRRFGGHVDPSVEVIRRTIDK